MKMKNDCTGRKDLPDIPEKIGVALSGGGSRAATFHLGALAYLDSADLLSRLSMISTVSGGTFTGAKFVLSLAEGDTFQDYFKDYYIKLKDTELVKLGLKALADGSTHAVSGRKDLIISMSQVYKGAFLQKPDGQPYLFKDILEHRGNIALDEVIFNATEFKYGGRFRFDMSPAHADWDNFGSDEMPIPRPDVGNIRMSDIVAASSCIPAGFEPIAFPDDFVWPHDKIPPDTRKAFPQPLPLMDGGIYDNEGIGSIVKADKQHGNILDAVIISDAAPSPGDVYNMPEVGEYGWLTLWGVDLFSWFVMIASLVTAVFAGFHLFKYGIFKDFFMHFMPMVLAGVTGISLWRLREFIKNNVLPNIPQVGSFAWKDLKRLKVKQLLDMINLRVDPLVVLTSTIFMDRVRELTYQAVYSDPHYDCRRIANLIYHLKTGSPFFPDLKVPPGVDEPSPALRRVADVADSMPTLLWFSEGYQQPCLAAAGQFTMCYNLMKYIIRRHGSKPATYSPEVKTLWDKLVSDWNAMVKDPYALLKRRLPDIDLPAPPA